MTVVSTACALVLLVILASGFRRGADLFSPGRVFGFIWALSIGLADLKLSMFQHNWTFYGWFVILLGVFAFLLGLVVVHVHHIRTPVLSLERVRSQVQASAMESIDPRRFFWAIVILFLAYILAYAAEVFIIGTVPLFARNPEKLRVTFGVFGLHLVVTSMLTIMTLAVEYTLFMPRDRRRQTIIGLVFLVTAGTFFLLLQRYAFATWALLSFGLAFYGSKKIRLRTVGIALSILSGVFVVIQNIRTAQYVEQYLYVISKMKFSREYAVFAEPYMYVVMNLENVARGAERLDHFYFGYFTFDWIVALTGIKHWLGEYFHIDRLPFMNSAYNTYAFQWWSFYDYGVIGVAVVALALGLFVGFSYYRLRTRPTIWTTYLYSIGLVFMITSFRENLFTRLDMVSNIALLWFLHRFVMIRREKTESPRIS